jgi:hypothetical protein
MLAVTGPTQDSESNRVGVVTAFLKPKVDSGVYMALSAVVVSSLVNLEPASCERRFLH